MNQQYRRISSLLVLVLTCMACSAQPAATLASTQAIIQHTATDTPAPSSTPLPLPTATFTPAPTDTPAATHTPVATPTFTSTPAPTATITPSGAGTLTPHAGTYAVVGVALDDVLNVRALAGAQHPIVGTIPPFGTEVEVTGDGVQVGGSIWVPVRYKALVGWANSTFLARQVGRADEWIAATAAQIIQAVQANEMQELSTWVHPTKGVRFSPYTYVRTAPDGDQPPDLVFTAAQIASLSGDRTIFHWGRYDGTGEPIDLTFDAYWARFVYDRDFVRPHVIGYNVIIGRGNTINNVAEIYAQAVTVEYHFVGFDPSFEGLDWKSLRLVLEEYNGVWYLVGIVHDEWTI